MVWRKLAFGLGFVGLGLLVAVFLYMIGFVLSITAPEGGEGFFWGGFLLSAPFLVPALIVAIALWLGHKDPISAALLEMLVGGLGLVIGLANLFEVLSLGTDKLSDPGYGLMDPLLIFTISGIGILLLVSGLLFWVSAKNLGGTVSSEGRRQHD